MPIVFDCAPDGAIIGGHFYFGIPEGAVESGDWQVVIQGAVYARLAHLVPPEMGMQPLEAEIAPLADIAVAQMGGVDGGMLAPTGTGGDDVMEPPVGAEQVRDGEQEQPIVPVAPTTRADRLRSPSPPPAASPAKKPRLSSPSHEVVLPIAVKISEKTGIATVANTALPNKKITPSASDIAHIGDIYPIRRALLVRDDEPYICNICHEGFPHPSDVRAHFFGNAKYAGRACWVKDGQEAGKQWNDHASCKVTEKEIQAVRCKEGWVIGDQASWDRIEAAVEEGRKFKEANAKVVKDGTAGVKKPGLGSGKGKGKASVKETADASRRQPPRKFVRAGDETETDIGAKKK